MNSDRLLSHEFIKAHPLDATRILERLRTEQIAEFLQDLPPTLAAEVAHLMDTVKMSLCLKAMDTKAAANLLTKLSVETAATLLRRADDWKQSAVLELLPEERADVLRSLLRFPEGTAGALMDPQVFTLPEDVTAKEALSRIRKQPEYVIYYVFVVSRHDLLVGVVSIRELMLAKPEDALSSVMQRDVSRLSPNLSYEAILAHPGWREHHALPVVEEHGGFLGAIRYHTIRRLEMEVRRRGRAAASQDPGVALGELYWIGLSAFFKGAAKAINPDE